MKYYACDKNHWWYCADNKKLRKNHVCHSGEKIKCGKLLKPKDALPPIKRNEKRIKPEPLAGNQLEDDPNGVPTTTPVNANDSYHYRCTSSVKRHYWTCTSRIDRPESAECPEKVMPFNAPCGKPLESMLFVLSDLQEYKPLDASQYNRPSIVVHTHAPTTSSSTLDLRQPRKYEAQSQAELTAALIDAGIALLCRDGQFRANPSRESSVQHQQSYVEEPGITRLGPLFAAVTTWCWSVIGRLEVMNYSPEAFKINPRTSGNVTYPDFTVEQNKQKFAVELKTPNTSTMAEYIAGSFYKELTSQGRPVEEEIEKRAAILPDDYLQMLAFDLHNLHESFAQSVAALQKEIRDGEHKTFWIKIKGFLFIDENRAVTSYSIDQFLALHTSQTTLGFVTTPSLVVNTTSNYTNSNNQPETS